MNLCCSVVLDIHHIKFMFPKKATKMTKYSPSIWQLLHTVKLTAKFLSIFVAFSDIVNFKEKSPFYISFYISIWITDFKKSHNMTFDRIRILNRKLSRLHKKMCQIGSLKIPCSIVQQTHLLVSRLSGMRLLATKCIHLYKQKNLFNYI